MCVVRLGPSELLITGSLKDWTAVEVADQIEASTLLINGRYDEIQDVAVEPFFAKIPRVKWVTLEQSSHLGQFEERERFMELVARFLKADA